MCKNDWSIFCAGPSINEVEPSDIEAPQPNRIAVNDAVRRMDLQPGYVAMMDVPALRKNSKHVIGKTIICPDSWKDKLDKNPVTLYDTPPDRFNPYIDIRALVEMNYQPRNPKIMKKAFWEEFKWARWTMYFACGWAIIQGAEKVTFWGVDFEGKYKESRWKPLRENFPRFVKKCEDIGVDIEQHGRYTF